MLELDITKPDQVQDVIESVEPDYVINLAANSAPGFGSPESFRQINQMGALNIARASLAARKPPRNCLFASSGTVYGGTDDFRRIRENTNFRPLSEYARSKVEMEKSLLELGAKGGISIVRPFNCIGPGQDSRFVAAKIVDHFRDRKSEISLGNISVHRDFVDIRDVAKWYASLLECNSGFVVNLAGGTALSIADLVARCEALTGHAIRVKSSAEFVRGNEPRYLCGSTARLHSLVGCRRLIPLEQTLSDMLAWPADNAPGTR